MLYGSGMASEATPPLRTSGYSSSSSSEVGVSRRSSRAECRGGEGENGEWIKALSSPEAAASGGSERPECRDLEHVQGAQLTSSPTKRTNVDFMDLSRNGRPITELAGSSALPCQPGAPGQGRYNDQV